MLGTLCTQGARDRGACAAASQQRSPGSMEAATERHCIACQQRGGGSAASGEAFHVLPRFASTQSSIWVQAVLFSYCAASCRFMAAVQSKQGSMQLKPWLCIQATGLQLVTLPPTLPFDSKGTSAVSEMP